MGINSLRIEVCELIEHLTGEDVRDVIHVEQQWSSTPLSEVCQEWRAFRFTAGSSQDIKEWWSAESREQLLAKISEHYQSINAIVARNAGFDPVALGC